MYCTLYDDHGSRIEICFCNFLLLKLGNYSVDSDGRYYVSYIFCEYGDRYFNVV